MTTYADAAELAWNQWHRAESSFETGWETPEPEPALHRFFRERIIPEIKRATIEINTTHAGLHAACTLFPDEHFPRSVELLLQGPLTKAENFLSFRMETDPLTGAGIFWYTGDNPMCKKLEASRMQVVEDLIVKFVAAAFPRPPAIPGPC